MFDLTWTSSREICSLRLRCSLRVLGVALRDRAERCDLSVKPGLQLFLLPKFALSVVLGGSRAFFCGFDRNVAFFRQHWDRQGQERKTTASLLGLNGRSMFFKFARKRGVLAIDLRLDRNQVALQLLNEVALLFDILVKLA